MPAHVKKLVADPTAPTISEWESAFTQAMESEPSGELRGVSVREIMAITGRGDRVVRHVLKTLIQSGKVEMVRVRDTDMAGRSMLAIRYRIKKETK